MYVFFSPKGEQVGLEKRLLKDFYPVKCNLRGRCCRKSTSALTHLMLVLLKEAVVRVAFQVARFGAAVVSPFSLQNTAENLSSALYLYILLKLQRPSLPALLCQLAAVDPHPRNSERAQMSAP